MDTVVQQSYAAKLYVAGGTSHFPTIISSVYGTIGGSQPAFDEISIVGDVTVNYAFSESNVSVRGAGGIELSAQALSQISLEFTCPVIRGDPKREALVHAALNRAVVGLAAVSGPITDVVTKGFAVDCQIFSMPIEEPIAGNLTQKFTAKPTLSLVDTNGTISPIYIVAGSTSGTFITATTF